MLKYMLNRSAHRRVGVMQGRVDLGIERPETVMRLTRQDIADEIRVMRSKKIRALVRVKHERFSPCLSNELRYFLNGDELVGDLLLGVVKNRCHWLILTTHVTLQRRLRFMAAYQPLKLKGGLS